MFENDHISVKSLGRLQKSVSYERLIQCRTFMPKHLFALGVEKSPKTAWREKIQMAAIFHLILNLNLCINVCFLLNQIWVSNAQFNGPWEFRWSFNSRTIWKPFKKWSNKFEGNNTPRSVNNNNNNNIYVSNYTYKSPINQLFCSKINKMKMLSVILNNW